MKGQTFFICCIMLPADLKNEISKKKKKKTYCLIAKGKHLFSIFSKITESCYNFKALLNFGKTT